MMHAGYVGHGGDTRKMTECKYHMEGRCTLGDRCPFRHTPELFNSAARAQPKPRSQPNVCHFYQIGKCTKGEACAFQHPGSQKEKEMQIDFDDDESPKQTQHGRSEANAAPASVSTQAQFNARLSPDGTGQLSRAVPQQPLSNRLGPQPGAQRRPVQTSTFAQEDPDKGKKTVFDRLTGGKGPSTVQSRLSKPAAPQLDSIPVNRAAKRPISDARELLLETLAAKARIGRKESEMAGRSLAGQAGQVRRGSSKLEPTSIAQRRVVAVNRGARNSPAAPHAPKYASPNPPDSNGQRKSALERIASPQNGAAPDAAAHPRNPSKLSRNNGEPFTSTRPRPTPTPASTPSQPPPVFRSTNTASTSAAGSAPQASSDQVSGGTDRRGRQRITWQPPTVSQADDASQDGRQSMSKRKASDAATPAVDSAAASATALVAEGDSPSKRMKAASNTVDVQQVPGAAPAGSSLKSEGTAEAAEAAIASEQAQQQHQVAGSEASAMDAVDGADEDLAQVDEDVDYDDVPYDDFDDEATMRELEALG